MKTLIKITLSAILLYVGLFTDVAAQTPYLNQIYKSSPSLQASRQLAGQVDGWFKDMDRAVKEYKRKNPNGNPAAEARGRAFISGMQSAYQKKQDASLARRKAELKRRYTDTYNKAKSSRDYYWVRGNYAKAREMQGVMDTYNPKKYKW